MSQSPILHIPHVAPTQNDKTTTMNLMIDDVEAATQAQLAVNMSSGNITLSFAQYTSAATFICSGQTTSVSLTVPSSQRVFVVRNAGSYAVTVIGGGGSSTSIAAGNGAVLQNDGEGNVFGFGAGGPGAPGAVWRTGSGAPSNSLGINGDFYLDDASGNVWEKISSSYTIQANIQGPSSLPTIAAGDIVGNAGTGSAVASGVSLSAILDAAVGTTHGEIIFRGTAGWLGLAPGSAGNVLVTNGSTQDPAWLPATGTTSLGLMADFVAGAGLAGGTITNGGTVSVASINSGYVLGNSSGTAAVPSAVAVGANLTMTSGSLAVTGAELTANKGQPSGYAGLDSGGRVPLAQLPASIGEALFFAGTWNAATNTPALASGTGTNGAMYTVTTAGTTTLDGLSSWSVGDKAVFDGTASAWRKIDGQPTEVVSVAGRTGVITLTAADIGGLNAIATQAAPAAGLVLSNGTSLIPATVGTGLSLSGSTLTATGAGSISSFVAGPGLSGGTVTNNGTVSLAPVGAGQLMGNAGSSSAVASGITLGANLSLTGTTLNAATGSVTAGTGIVVNSGTVVSLAPTGGTTLLGVSGTASAVPTGVTLGTNLSFSGNTLNAAVGLVSAGTGIAVNSGTISLAPIAGGQIMGVSGSSSAVPAGITLGANLSFSGNTLNASSSLLSPGAGIAINTGTVSLAAIGPATILGNSGTGSASPQALTLGQGLTMSGTTIAADLQGTITATTSGTVNPAGLKSCLINVGTTATTLTVSPGYPGQALRLEILMGATAQTVGFDSTVEFGADTTSYTATTTGSKRDLVQLIMKNTGTQWMFAAVQHGF